MALNLSFKGTDNPPMYSLLAESPDPKHLFHLASPPAVRKFNFYLCAVLTERILGTKSWLDVGKISNPVVKIPASLFRNGS